ncbi:hypothetical protein OHV05_37420 (plasmid) [Kitasatospora sp. NBC_00070]|uniref:hypothetical protein n=1 Tax=Kitasatospora sp. NBC_00070 TaxID=2975962 RepID=UPI0032430378
MKSPTSRYPANPATAHPLTSQKIMRLDIEIHREISRPDAPLAGGSSNGQTGAGRRNQVLQFLRASPDRAWHATEIAQVLGWTNYRSVCTQLAYWAREGLLQKVARATYTLAPAWMLHDHQQPRAIDRPVGRLTSRPCRLNGVTFPSRLVPPEPRCVRDGPCRPITHP